MLDEVPQPGQRLLAGSREQSRAVPADELDAVLALPAVEVAAYFFVDLVLDDGRRRRHVQALDPAGWRLPVVGVQVPPAPGGLGAVHEDAVPPPRVPVEVLHPQAAASVGPGDEVGR